MSVFTFSFIGHIFKCLIFFCKISDQYCSKLEKGHQKEESLKNCINERSLSTVSKM